MGTVGCRWLSVSGQSLYHPPLHALRWFGITQSTHAMYLSACPQDHDERKLRNSPHDQYIHVYNIVSLGANVESEADSVPPHSRDLVIFHLCGDFGRKSAHISLGSDTPSIINSCAPYACKP